jgi:hypothetical protein
MKKVLLSLFLLGIVSVCFADAGEVNEREFICAKFGRIGSSTVDARLHGHSLAELIEQLDAQFEINVMGTVDADQIQFQKEMRDFVKDVYENTEDNTPLAAYATQYTRCLTHEIFNGVHVFLKN